MPNPNDNTPQVKTRDLDWKSLVEKRWGKEWSKPDPAYEFSGGRKFETPKQGGPYGD